MTKEFQIHLLGNPEIKRQGHIVAGPAYEKGWGLLAYLATETRWHSREELGEIFWPNASGKRANLRQVLSNLRGILNDHDSLSPVLQVSRHTLRFNPDSRALVDISELLSEQTPCTISACTGDCATCIEHKHHLASLYRGELLSHLNFSDCPDFDDWLQIQREKFQRHAISLLENLLACTETSGDKTKSLAIARHLEEISPSNEKAQRHYMRRYALDGQVSLALKQFDVFTDWLHKELGASPEAETRILYDQIRSGNHNPHDGAPPSSPSVSPAHLEHRQVTVLYFELNIPGHDLDDMTEQKLPLVQQAMEIITRQGGLVVPTHSGNFLAYFGYPSALENAASLAVKAALELSRLPNFSENTAISLHTGRIATRGDRNMPDVTGKTTDVTIRLCHAIPSGGPIISGATHTLVSDYFKTHFITTLELHPTLPAIKAYQVLEASPASTRLDVANQLTPMVGRKKELAYLKKYWTKTTKTRTRHALLVRGEPGIGKSRLVQHFENTVATKPGMTIKWHCREEYSGTALHTVTEYLSKVCAFTLQDNIAEKTEKLENYLAQHFPSINDQSLILLARLLSLNPDGRFDLPELIPQQEKLLVFNTLIDMLSLAASQRPLLFVLEDAHWADHSTLELLERLIADELNTPIFILLTTRPEFHLPKKVLTLNLLPLSQEESICMVDHIRQPCDDISPEKMQLITRTTDGIPLFIEEMTRTLVDEKNEIFQQSIIPATLSDLLAARLDKLGEAKILAQAAATIGRQFSVDLLQAALPDKDSHDIAGMLGTLQKFGMISMHEYAESGYQFKHALIADTAYQSQSRPARRLLHSHIAVALAANNSAAPELAAKHYFEAGNSQKAIEWWTLAGTNAAAKFANAEAIGHFNRALATIEALAYAPDRDKTELGILVELGRTQISSFGYGSPEANQTYQRAFTLSEKTGLSLSLFQTIWGLYLGCSSRTNHRDALELANRLLELARIDGSPPLLIAAHYALTNTSYSLGYFADAIRHMDTARKIYRPDQDDSIVSLFGEHVLVSAMQFGSWALWTVSRHTDSIDTAKEALAIAQRIDHPPTLCFAHCFCGTLYRLHGEIDKVREHGEILSALATKQGFELWQVIGSLIEGWAQAAQGDPGGVLRISAVVDIMQKGKLMGGILMYFLEMLAEAHGMLGNYTEQMVVLDQAITVMNRIQDTHFEAEIYRLKGECYFQLYGDGLLSMEWLHRAKEVACRQGASGLVSRVEASMAKRYLDSSETGIP